MILYGNKNPNMCNVINKTLSTNKNKNISSLSELFDLIPIKDNMTLAFHHHLRNGDYVLNMVLEEIKKRDLKGITIASSAIFPVHEPMVELIENENITKIYTNYINGPVAKAVSEGHLKELLIMDTHGGRPRAIESGELKIDVAFISVPTSTINGDGNGIEGKSACGALGYAISDMYYANKKVVITDNLVENIDYTEIEGKYIDYVLQVESIGDPKGILSGTTKPTTNPVQLKIAKDTTKLMIDLNLIKNGFSFQTGAGSTSISVASLVRDYMKENNIKGAFASGGITSFLVKMLEENLFENLYDVQCFDLDGVKSYSTNKNHLPMSASLYANPCVDNIASKLDVVILGATEIDFDFNVNVTTDSNGYLMGGSGGHADTSYGSKVTIITTTLIKSRLGAIKPRVTTITTPGSTVDILVTERGIAINPKRTDLLNILKSKNIKTYTIKELYDIQTNITGLPDEINKSNKIIGYVRYFDGTILDEIHKVGD